MATLGSVTYSFTNGTTILAGEVNTNYTDLVNATEDGSTDFSIAALTCAGTATFNGNVAVGNSVSDDLTITFPTEWTTIVNSNPYTCSITYTTGGNYAGDFTNPASCLGSGTNSIIVDSTINDDACNSAI